MRPRRSAGPKLSWEDTALAMSAEPEDWSDWDATLADGLDDIPWEPVPAKRVAEPKRTSPVSPKWRTRVEVRVAKRHAEIAVDQIRTISKARLGKKLGALTPTDASALRRLITEMYGE